MRQLRSAITSCCLAAFLVGWRCTGHPRVVPNTDLPILHSDPFGVYMLAYSPDGSVLATGGYYTLTIWDLKSLRPRAVLPGAGGHNAAVVFSPDGKLLAAEAPNGRDTRLFDTRTWKMRHIIKDGVGIAFSPDGHWLALAGADHGDVIDIKLWNVHSGHIGHLLKLHAMSLDGMAFSQTGRWLAAVGLNKIIIWDTRTWQIKREMKEPEPIHRIVFSPDDRVLASGTDSGMVKLWDTSNWKLNQTLNKKAEKSGVHAIEFSKDRKRLLAVWGGNVIVWDTSTWKPVLTCGPATFVSDIKIDLEKQVAYPVVKPKDLPGFHPIDLFATTASFSPNGSTIAVAGWEEPDVILWRLPPHP